MVSVSPDNMSDPSQKVTVPAALEVNDISWPFIRTQNQLETASITLNNGGHIYPDQGKKIGEILKSLGAIDDKIIEGVEKRHHTKKAKDKPTGELLVYMGIIQQEVLTRALCIQAGVPLVEAESINIPYNVLKLVSNDDARAKHAVPVGVYHGTLFLAVRDPLNFPDQHFFSFSTRLKIKPVYAPDSQIVACLNSRWNAEGSEVWAG